MIKFIRNLLKGRKQQYNIPDDIHSITYGERDKDGFTDTYVNGKKTNVRLLFWDKEEVENLQKISEEIHNKKSIK